MVNRSWGDAPEDHYRGNPAPEEVFLAYAAEMT